MENIEIIILSSIVCTLFVVFAIVIYKEANTATDQSNDSYEKSPRADMIRFVGSIFDVEATKKMTKKEKQVVYTAVKRTIADMESNGIYFSDDVKDKLRQQKEELHCEYSGLPSVKAYEQK